MHDDVRSRHDRRSAAGVTYCWMPRTLTVTSSEQTHTVTTRRYIYIYIYIHIHIKHHSSKQKKSTMHSTSKAPFIAPLKHHIYMHCWHMKSTGLLLGGS